MALVENRARCGQGGVHRWTDLLVRWTACGRLKNLENCHRIPLCSPRGWRRTSLPAKTGTTRRELRETRGRLRGAWRERREPRNALWFEGNFGPTGALCGPSGATLGAKELILRKQGDRATG